VIGVPSEARGSILRACGYPLRRGAYPTGYGGDKGPIYRESSTVFSRSLLFEHREGFFEPGVWRVFSEVRAQDWGHARSCALELPFQVPRILKDPQGADLCLLRWMGVLLEVQTEDKDEIIKAVPCRRCQ
jgi:hypothetical protein